MQAMRVDATPAWQMVEDALSPLAPARVGLARLMIAVAR